MITIIIGTNSVNSVTAAVADIYAAYLTELGEEFQLLDMREMPTGIIAPDMYVNPKPEFLAFQERYLFPAEKFIIIIPEYNAGIPGIFKLMMDASDIKQAWYGKKATITGVASGRAGNLRGLDSLTNILNYLKVNVHYNKLPISRVRGLINEERELIDEKTISSIKEQIGQFLAF
ncbi:MAG: NAD(P)H-dependent oxidoreductase [Bacteroidota bacterium]